MQAQVEELTGQAGLQILRAILENEVTRRVGPPHRPNPAAGCVCWGKQPGYVVFAGQKIPLERPRVRTREGQEVEMESYGQLQQDGKLQRAVRERMVAGLSTRNYRRAVNATRMFALGSGIDNSLDKHVFLNSMLDASNKHEVCLTFPKLSKILVDRDAVELQYLPD